MGEAKRRGARGIPPRRSDRNLQAALAPFATFEHMPDGTDGEDIWIYIGRYDGTGEPPHLKLADFRRAKKVAG